MRDPNRIPIILKALEEIWSKNPDLRLGQLLENLVNYVDYHFESLYYIEDNQLIEELKRLYDIQ